MRYFTDVFMFFAALAVLILIWRGAADRTRQYLPTLFAGTLFWLVTFMPKGLISIPPVLLTLLLSSMLPKFMTERPDLPGIRLETPSLAGWIVVTIIVLVPIAVLNRLYVTRRVLTGTRAAVLSVAPVLVPFVCVWGVLWSLEPWSEFVKRF